MTCCGAFVMPVELNPPMPKPTKSFELKGWHVLAMLVTFFAVIFAVNFTMMNLAIRTMPGTDVKSSFEASQHFNGQLDAIAAQDSRGWQVDIATGAIRSGAPLQVSVRDKAGEALGGLGVSARIERPADARFDKKLSLGDLGGGRYSVDLPQLGAGQWLLTVEISRGADRLFVSQRRVLLKE
ncbi:MAG: nitrogen fixation protein FixH [Rhizobiales bacterium PAR1]|nr:MAG: nitrogen fixation protein FixH [Rhizobiales bacterium PAR1]